MRPQDPGSSTPKQGTFTMGIDHGLYRRRYIENSEWTPNERRGEVTLTVGGKEVALTRPTYIDEEVIDWRKANAIHAWFVDSVQGGVDDCRDSYVSREDLEQLLGVVKQVLGASKLKPAKVVVGQRGTANGWEDMTEDGEVIEDPSLAAELLPTTKGFFFGSTDYDQFYYEDLERTQEALTTVLEDPTAQHFRYWSSW